MAVIYNSYFGKFPKIDYDIRNVIINKQYEKVTNIFFRIKYISEVLNNLSSYYSIELEDSETPEIIAEKVYNDAGHWDIMHLISISSQSMGQLKMQRQHIIITIWLLLESCNRMISQQKHVTLSTNKN
jgi:hypothetical protein